MNKIKQIIKYLKYVWVESSKLRFNDDLHKEE